MKQRANIILSVLILIIIATACNLTEPFSLPAWDSIFKIHFREDQITFKDIIVDNDVVDERFSENYLDTLFFISVDTTIEKQGVDESELGFKPDDDQTIEEIGTIELNPEPQSTPQITFQDLFPGLTIEEGQTIPQIPPQVVNPAPNKANFESEFQSVTIESATMFLIFYNDLIMDVDSGLVITLVDSGSNSEIGSFEFDQLIPVGGSAQSDNVLLENLVLSSAFNLDYSIPLAGTGGPIVLTQDDVNSGVTAEVHFLDMNVASAFAAVPEQSLERTGANFLDSGDNSLIEALIRSGRIQFVILNNTSVDADVEVQLLSLTQNNDPLTINTVILANVIDDTLEVDLAGASLANYLNPGSVIDSIHYILQANTISTGDSFVNISSTDNIEVNIIFPDSIRTSAFQGIITNTELQIEPFEKTDLINLDEFEGKFRLPDFEITFDFYNEMGFDVALDLTITGSKEGETPIVINLQEVINGTTTSGPATIGVQNTPIILRANSTTPDIVDLMEIQPTSIRIEGTGVIEGPGSVEDTDSIWADVRIESVLKMQITDTLKFSGDIEDINLDEGIREDFSKSKNVLLELNPDNGLPLNVEYLFVMALDTTDMFSKVISDSTEKIVLNGLIEAGTIDQNGLVSESNLVTIREELTETQLQIFSKKDSSGAYIPIYSGVKVLIDSEDEAVIFRKNDSLIFDGFFEMNLEVN